jgi:hypothetical protein
MDAKYNYLIDSWKWRVSLNAVAFSLWLGVLLGLLKAA